MLTLHRHSGQEDIITGTPTAARPLADFYGLVGFFVNPVALRSDLSGNPTFSSFLGQVHLNVMQALTHQNYPFPVLVSKLRAPRDVARSPVFQNSFLLHSARLLGEQATLLGYGRATASTSIAGLQIEAYPILQQEGQFDLVLEMVELNDACLGMFKYDAKLFDEAAIERMVGHFQTLLAGIVATPDCTVQELPLLMPAELSQLTVWNATRMLSMSIFIDGLSGLFDQID